MHPFRSLRVGFATTLIASALVGVTAVPRADAAATFESLVAPARIADTRPGGVTVDTRYQKTGLVQAGTTMTLEVAGRANVPVDSSTVALNVTTTGAVTGGYMTVYPCNSTPPNSSNLNFSAGQVIANAVFAKLDSSGSICIFTSATAHVIVDVTGSLPPGAFAPLEAPARLLDSRPEGVTIDLADQKIGLRGAGTTTVLPIAGRGTIAADASTVVLNVTTTAAATGGYLTVFPCDQPQPNTSNLNFSANQVIANSVVARLDPSGRTCIFTSATAHLIVDVTGSLPTSTYTSLVAPQRLADSRPSGETTDDRVEKDGFRRAGTTLSLPIRDRAAIPATATAVVLNVTAAGPRGGGYLTLHPRNSPRPNSSNLNYAAGRSIANTVVAKVGGGGEVCIFASGPTDLIVDIAGYFTGPVPADSGLDCPFEYPGVSDFDDPYYPVGQNQMRPGRYRANVTTQIFCRAARLASDDQFDVNGIILPFEGPVIIDVLPTDKFVHYRFDTCPPLVPYRQPTTAPPTSFTSGYYVVGTDQEISPGTYRSGPLEPDSFRCGASRLSSFRGDPAFGRPDPTIIQRVLSETGNATITIKSTDAGVTFGNTCDPWVKIS